jgi:hypothetical protein
LTKLGAKKSYQKALDRNLSLLLRRLSFATIYTDDFIKEGLKQTDSIGGGVADEKLQRKERAEEKRKLQDISTPNRRKRGKSSMEQFEVHGEGSSKVLWQVYLPAAAASISPIPKATRQQQPRETKTKLQEATCCKEGNVLLEYDLYQAGRTYTAAESTPLWSLF